MTEALIVMGATLAGAIIWESRYLFAFLLIWGLLSYLIYALIF